LPQRRGEWRRRLVIIAENWKTENRKVKMEKRRILGEKQAFRWGGTLMV
jgi:hypothetical protein